MRVFLSDGDKRMIVALRHEGMLMKQIAAAVGRSQATISVVLERARQRPCTIETWNRFRHPLAAPLGAWPFRDHKAIPAIPSTSGLTPAATLG